MSPYPAYFAGDTSDREIVLSRVFAAPRERVWKAMTSPEHVVHWWGPNGFATEITEMDLRVGGAWALVMIGPDGARYPNKSIFREIIPLERVAYSHGGGREDGAGPGATFVAGWTFEALDAHSTRLTLRMVFPDAGQRDAVVREYGAVEGGKQTLRRLGDFLPALAPAAAETLAVTRVFTASPEVVFDAWLNPDSARRWLFATPAGEMQRVEIDGREGGRFTIVEKRGDQLAGHFGRHEIIERPHRLVFAFATDPAHQPTRVTVVFEPEDDGCRITLTHPIAPEWAAFAERARKGWTTILAGLAAAAKNNAYGTGKPPAGAAGVSSTAATAESGALPGAG